MLFNVQNAFSLPQFKGIVHPKSKNVLKMSSPSSRWNVALNPLFASESSAVNGAGTADQSTNPSRWVLYP